MKYRFVVFVVSVLAALSGLAADTDAGTTAASGASFSYDVPTIARIDMYEFAAADARPTQLGGSRELSGLPAAEADRRTVDEAADLATAMGLGRDTADRLEPLVREPRHEEDT